MTSVWRKAIVTTTAAALLSLAATPAMAVKSTEPSKPTSSYTVSGASNRAALTTSTTSIEKMAIGALSEAAREATDAELVAFLLLAKGPIADRNPNAVATAESQIPGLDQVTDAEAIEAAQAYLDETPSFATTIRPALLSSNPMRVEVGLDRFGMSFMRYIDEELTHQGITRTSAELNACNGSWCVKQTALAVTTAAVVWQVAGLHTAAAVTIATALAVIIYLPGSDQMNSVDGQRFVNSFMSGLRA